MTEAQYALIVLMEECAEVQKVCAKMLRFGELSAHPRDASHTPNFILLQNELADVIGAWDFVKETHSYDELSKSAMIMKRNKIAKYVEKAKKQGIIDD